MILPTEKPLVYAPKLKLLGTAIVAIYLSACGAEPEPDDIFPTPTPSATSEPSPNPTQEPTVTPIPSPPPTMVVTPTATPEPTATPTAIPTITPTTSPAPTAVPTPLPPTSTPEPSATPSATPEPTTEPTLAPSPEPTEEPSPEPTDPAAAGKLNPLDGFASVSGMGLSTTTGGKGGPVHTVTTGSELEDLLANNDNPVIILVKGEIDMGGGHISMRSNKTVIGLEGAKLYNGGFEFYKDSNIIFRNVTIENGNVDDAFKINQESHHIWIDHVTLSNYGDGLLDITRGSSYITVSWCHFKNHDKTLLIGHTNGYALDKDRLKTTLHHNWFDSTGQRHPRVRQAEVHVYNNFFYNINGNNGFTGEGYGIASADGASVRVENNYFQDVTTPMQSGVPGYSSAGDITHSGNIFDNSGDGINVGSVFEAQAYYSYTLDDAASIPELVRNNAGAGVIDPQEALEMAK